MKDKATEDKKHVRMELKCCEHCGTLWLRECGAGVVYCDHCQPKIDDLPMPKKRPGRLLLPVRRRTVVDGYEADPGNGDEIDFEAMGGVA
jgi:hypothetical protein